MEIFYLGWFLLIPLLFLWLKNRKLAQENVEFRIGAMEIQTKLFEQEKTHSEKMDLVRETKERMEEVFKGFSLEAMEKFHRRSELDLAKKEETLLKAILPVKEGLVKLDEGMRNIEKERKGESEGFKHQIKAVLASEKELRDETANLVRALRRPEVRGFWGELQLKRIVELSGMINNCDFYEQKVGEGEDEKKFRPDLLIRLPGDKQVVVDAKAPLDAFLEANHITDPDKKEARLKDHARLLKQHIQQLGKKSYWQHFQPSPEFVILFLPVEIFFSAALQYDPTLIELAAENNVILATPTTLIGLLRAIAYGWKQDKFSKHAAEISELGHELYKRLNDMGKHWSQVGRSLTTAVDSYNKAIGSFEKRVLVSARKFKEFGAANSEIELEAIEFVEKIPRHVSDPILES